MNILISGGTGFVGRSFMDHLATLVDFQTKPFQLTVLSRNPAKFLGEFKRFSKYDWIDFIEADVLAPKTLPFQKKFTHIIHAATEATISSCIGYKEQFIQIVEGARNMLDLAVETGAQRFLLTSSGAAYGPQPAEVTNLCEDWLGSPSLEQPQHAYGLGKRAAEHLCALYQDAHGLETVVCRCFAFVGPDLPLNAHYAIGNFIRDALNGKPITVAGNGTPLRSYMDQRDMAQWLLKLLLEGKSGNLYNVGSDEAVTIQELAYLVREIIAPQLPVNILGESQVLSSRNRYIPSIEKARRLHGLKITIPLIKAIEYTALAHQKS